MRSLLLAVFALWRATLGSVLPPSCRFTPSCSRYATEAVARHGALVGLALTTWRLLRCQPWGGSGYDPVVRSRPPCRPRPGG